MLVLAELLLLWGKVHFSWMCAGISSLSKMHHSGVVLGAMSNLTHFWMQLHVDELLEGIVPVDGLAMGLVLTYHQLYQ